MGGYLLGTAFKSEAEIKRQAASYAAHYEDRADIAIQSECFDIAPTSRDACAIEKREAQREAQREEYDLAAQRTMATWTKSMGIAAIVGMMVGLVGLGLIYATFQATRRQVILADRSLKIQTRPFLYLKAIEWEETRFEDTGGLHFELTALLNNAGLLPATNLRVWATAVAVVPADAESFEHVFDDDPMTIPIHPPSETKYAYYGLTLTKEEAEQFDALKLSIAFGIKVQFDTRFVLGKTVEEFRWGDAYIMRQKNRLYHNQGLYMRRMDDGDDLFQEQEEQGTEETSHDPHSER